MASQDFSAKTVLITGASRGIGAASARAFADAGANVVLTARSEDALAELAAEIGEKALALPCDVADAKAVQDVVAKTLAHFGSLDVLIGNAGMIAPISRLADTDPDAYSRTIDVNLKGVFYGMQAVLPHMVAQGAGTIITISSGAAHGPRNAARD